MEAVGTQRRVERMIRECRVLGVEPESSTIAEIMVDDDVTGGRLDPETPEWGLTFAKYEEFARRKLPGALHH